MSIVFAATYPERTQALVLYGGMARATEAPGYPWGPSAEGFVEATEELIMPVVYTGGDIDMWAPSLDEDPAAREWLGRYRRAAMSPDGIEAVIKMFLEIDVRHVLPTLHVPTLVLHRHGDRSSTGARPSGWRNRSRVQPESSCRAGSLAVGRRHGRDRGGGAGIPHRHAGRRGAGSRARNGDVHRRGRVPRRKRHRSVTAVGPSCSTRTTPPSAASSWPSVVKRSRRSVMGSSRPSTGPRAAFAARVRFVRRRDRPRRRCARRLAHRRDRAVAATTSAALPSTSASGSRRPPRRPRSSCRAPSRTSWPDPASSSKTVVSAS